MRGYLVRNIERKRNRYAAKIQGYVRMKWLSSLFQDIKASTRIIQV